MANAPKKPAAARTTYKERFKHGAPFPLRGVREALHITQVQASEASSIPQPEISRLERAGLDERQIGTLRRYLEGLGAKLELVAVLPTGHRFILVAPPEE